MHWIKAILIAVSLCADCFAVSLCSGVRAPHLHRDALLGTALLFALVQTAFLLVGWAMGSAVAGLVQSVGPFIGFLLLLYVGGTMLLEGIRNVAEAFSVDSWWHIFLGGIATSIDALAVGASQSLSGQDFRGLVPLAVSVFAVTALSVVLGLLGGGRIGAAYGRRAEIAGGLVLIAIGISLFF